MANRRPRVAVIVRTKDRSLLLSRALDDILNQTMEDWELVVVNDGGSARPVDELVSAREERLAKRCRGPSGARGHPTGSAPLARAGQRSRCAWCRPGVCFAAGEQYQGKRAGGPGSGCAGGPSTPRLAASGQLL